MERVAVVGMGVVSSVGVGIPSFTAALRAGARGFSPIKAFRTPRGKLTAGVVRDPAFDGPDRAFRMARAAAVEACAEAQASLGDGDDVALLLSTIAGDSKAAEDRYLAFMEAGTPDEDLAQALRSYPAGALAHALACDLRARGPRVVVTNACASGNIAVGLALDMLNAGRCTAAIVVGVEIVKATMVWGADRSGFTGSALRAFHAKRDGSVLGEGAAALVLSRGGAVDVGRVLGWIEGFGCVCDRGAAAITLLPDGSGLRRAMAAALNDAGRRPEEIEYLNAHAPGTRMIDLLECKALTDLCGEHAETVAINATKGITSHTGGASAVIEIVATLIQMREGFLHPNAGLDEPDPALPLRPLGATAVARRVTRALSNACGGGGLNTSIVVTAADEPAPVTRRAQASKPDVVITGLGVVCGRGAGSAQILADAAPRPAVPPRRLDWFDIGRFYEPAGGFSYMNRAAQLAAAAARIAVEQAALRGAPEPYASDRIAVVAGTFLGGGPEASDVLCRGLLRNPDLIRPSMSLDHGVHLGATLVVRHYDLQGPTYTLTGTRVAGLQALAIAADMIHSGRADAAIVLGFDALDLAAERAASLLLGCRLGEGAGALVLERSSAARARGAPEHAAIASAYSFAVGASDDAAPMGNILGRIAGELCRDRPVALYVDDSDDGRADQLVRKIIEDKGVSFIVRRLDPDLGSGSAADAIIAVATAALRGESAAVLSTESDSVVLVRLEPPTRLDARLP